MLRRSAKRGRSGRANLQQVLDDCANSLALSDGLISELEMLQASLESGLVRLDGLKAEKSAAAAKAQGDTGAAAVRCRRGRAGRVQRRPNRGRWLPLRHSSGALNWKVERYRSRRD